MTTKPPRAGSSPLQPKQTGTVTIPSLQVGDYHSLPINLTVTQSSASDSELAPVFIGSQPDQPSVYVQAWRFLTPARLPLGGALRRQQLDLGCTFKTPSLSKLGESRTYEKADQWRARHGVIEVRYIYPQHSGELQIPALTFSATQQTTSSATPRRPARQNPEKWST